MAPWPPIILTLSLLSRPPHIGRRRSGYCSAGAGPTVSRSCRGGLGRDGRRGPGCDPCPATPQSPPLRPHGEADAARPGGADAVRCCGDYAALLALHGRPSAARPCAARPFLCLGIRCHMGACRQNRVGHGGRTNEEAHGYVAAISGNILQAQQCDTCAQYARQDWRSCKYCLLNNHPDKGHVSATVLYNVSYGKAVCFPSLLLA